MENDKRAELLMDHYKDTSQLIERHWSTRNKLFIYTLLILAFMAIDLVQPGSISSVINLYLQKSLGPGTPSMAFHVVGPIIWFLLLSVVIHYYQRSITVDRKFRYIQSIEEELCRQMESEAITREGKSYYSCTGVVNDTATENRPVFLRQIGYLYTHVFPVLLMLFIVLKLYGEARGQRTWSFYFDLVLGAALFVYNILYMRWTMSKRTQTRG